MLKQTLAGAAGHFHHGDTSSLATAAADGPSRPLQVAINRLHNDLNDLEVFVANLENRLVSQISQTSTKSDGTDTKAKPPRDMSGSSERVTEIDNAGVRVANLTGRLQVLLDRLEC